MQFIKEILLSLLHIPSCWLGVSILPICPLLLLRQQISLWSRWCIVVVLVLKIHSAAGNFYHESSNLAILTNGNYGLFSLGCLASVRYLDKKIYIYSMKIVSKKYLIIS